jgi:penicillin G amidase
MKIGKFLISLLLTIGLIYVLNKKWGSIPPLGKMLSPQHGFWQNAETKADLSNQSYQFTQLKGAASVYMDNRLVPHVFAQHNEDAFFIQGFLHAKYRLWQMEFQTYFAAGRISEIVGAKAIQLDRKFRRLGMVYAAKNSLKEMEKDADTKLALENYANGVNAYINSLSESQLPIEYKLLDYKPEQWSTLKTALLLKYMSFDLAGYEEDFEKENTKAILTKAMYETAYLYGNDSLSPIIYNTLNFSNPEKALTIPKNVDSVYFNFAAQKANDIVDIKPNKNNGSNNWAVSGSKTKSGKPILCNDPHLGLNLPSLWYEMQLNTPSFNTYGATLPGAPAVIIGFNDSCSFGFTNAMRDVRDYYEIKFKDNSKKEYLFNGKWEAATIEIENIKCKDAATFYDTVAYVKEFGPVMYDNSYRGTALQQTTADRTNGKNYAVRWIAHDASNELRTFLLLNKSKNYKDYLNAINGFSCPGQNMIFACNSGDIAIKQQGKFPAKWYRQGDFPMPGWDSTYAWQGYIPEAANIQMYNPTAGFVSSANQYPYNTKTYPYYLGGNYMTPRGYQINNQLALMNNITVTDMQHLQNNNFNVFARMMLPLLIQKTNTVKLNANAQKYLTQLKSWNYEATANSEAQTLFTLWNDELEANVWYDELVKANTWVRPLETTLYDVLVKDSNMVFVNNINTTEKESLQNLVTNSLNNIALKADSLSKTNSLAWAKHKKTMIKHLIDKDANMAFSRFDLNIGGGMHIINATQKDHGPSWKMIVEMKDKVDAYGIYPGGQSGNPGSKYYDNAVKDWAAGKYYKLWLMHISEKESKDILFTLTFNNK